MLLAFVAGLVTLLNPCVLPILPIVIGSSIMASRLGPVALAGGLVLSFSVFGLLILTVGFSIGIDADVLRLVAASIMIAAGVLLAIPQAQARFATLLSPIASGGGQLLGRISGNGLASQFAIGALLGVVWTPCTGPTLGAAIAAASQGDDLASSFLTFLVFGLGVALSLLALAYGSRGALASRMTALRSAARWGKPILGGILIVVGVAIVVRADKYLESAVLDVLPQSLIEFTTRF